MPPPTSAYHVTSQHFELHDQDIYGVDIAALISASHVKIWRCRFHHLTDSGGNATAFAIEDGVEDVLIEDCEIDGTDSPSTGAGGSLHPGSNGVTIRCCHFHHMKKVGLSIGSTTYVEMLALYGHPLHESYGHCIDNNLFEFNGQAHDVGDAGSGLVMVGAARDHEILNNRFRYNYSAGCVIAGSLVGDGVTTGTPALTELPTNIRLFNNRFNRNGEEGLRLVGPNQVQVIENSSYESNQRKNIDPAAAFYNYRFAQINHNASTLTYLTERHNASFGSLPAGAIKRE